MSISPKECAFRAKEIEGTPFAGKIDREIPGYQISDYLKGQYAYDTTKPDQKMKMFLSLKDDSKYIDHREFINYFINAASQEFDDDHNHLTYGYSEARVIGAGLAMYHLNSYEMNELMNHLNHLKPDVRQRVIADALSDRQASTASTRDRLTCEQSDALWQQAQDKDFVFDAELFVSVFGHKYSTSEILNPHGIDVNAADGVAKMTLFNAGDLLRRFFKSLRDVVSPQTRDGMAELEDYNGTSTLAKDGGIQWDYIPSKTWDELWECED